MDLANRISIRCIAANEPQLPAIIRFSVGNPTNDKILEIVRNYHSLNHKIVGAFVEDILIGMIGLLVAEKSIIIKHISILPSFQRRRLGTLILSYVKEYYPNYTIIAETDEESIGFYLKLGFICDPFKGKYGNLRYRCVLIDIVIC